MKGRSLLRAHAWLLVIILYIPLVIMAINSFNNSKFIGDWQGSTLKWYRLLLVDPELATAVKNSLMVAVLSALISLLLAFPAALSVSRAEKRLSLLLLYPPIIIPEITEAVALMLFFVYIGFPLGAVSVLIGHTTFNIAYVYIVLSSVSGESRRLEMVARTLGASRISAFLRITLPLLAPAIASGLAIAFLMSFTDFVKTLFTSGPGFETLTLLIWNRARRPGLNPFTSQPYLAAITTILVVINLLVLVLYLYATKEYEK
jgi:spermidine/putrescine transport system permease protein